MFRRKFLSMIPAIFGLTFVGHGAIIDGNVYSNGGLSTGFK